MAGEKKKKNKKINKVVPKKESILDRLRFMQKDFNPAKDAK